MYYIFLLIILVLRKCNYQMKVLIVEKLRNWMVQNPGNSKDNCPRRLEMIQGRKPSRWHAKNRTSHVYCRSRRRNLCLQSRRHPFLKSVQFCTVQFCQFNMSIQTVRRILSISGLHGRVASKKPLLSCTHIRSRLSWCKTYLQMGPNILKLINFRDKFQNI